MDRSLVVALAAVALAADCSAEQAVEIADSVAESSPDGTAAELVAEVHALALKKVWLNRPI